MADSSLKSGKLPSRLCSEIQLFDLCDLETCLQKNGRFCTDTELLCQFEKVAENELRIPERGFSEELDDADMDDEFGSGGDGEVENFEDDYDIDREEE